MQMFARRKPSVFGVGTDLHFPEVRHRVDLYEVSVVHVQVLSA